MWHHSFLRVTFWLVLTPPKQDIHPNYGNWRWPQACHHHCCSALGRDTLKSLCCFHLTDVQEEGMLQSGCDCEHRSSLLQSCKLLYFYPSFIWRVLWSLQKDITVCLPCCRMTKHLRAKFGINNIVTPKLHSFSCTTHALMP